METYVVRGDEEHHFDNNPFVKSGLGCANAAPFRHTHTHVHTHTHTRARATTQAHQAVELWSKLLMYSLVARSPLTAVLPDINARMDALHDVHMLKNYWQAQHLRPVTWDPGRSGDRSKNPENLAKLRCGCGGVRIGALQETFLGLQPGTVVPLVEKVSRRVSKSMHASLPVHGERLHDVTRLATADARPIGCF